MQLVQERIANAAMDLFASACVLARWDGEVQKKATYRNGGSDSPQHRAADLFLRQSFRRIRVNLAGLNDNDDQAILEEGTAALFVLHSGMKQSAHLACSSPASPAKTGLILAASVGRECYPASTPGR